MSTDDARPEALAKTPAPEAQPAAPYPSPLRMGQWDHMQIGACIPLAEDQLITKTYYGLRHTGTWFNLYLRNSAGKYYFISNGVQTPAGESERKARAWLVPMASVEASLVADPRCALWDGKVVHELTPDKKSRYTVETQGSSDEISFNEMGINWASKNKDIMLAGNLSTPALQFLLPWREPNGDTDAMYYTGQYYNVDGTYLGEPVHGYALIEHIWGTRNYADTWWVQNRMVYWPRWTTTYDDGVTEMGDMMLGEHGARGALIVNSNGEVIVNTAEFQVDLKPDGRAVYTFANGPQWEFTPEIQFPGLPLGIGSVKRIGETRKIVRSHAVYLLQGQIPSGAPFGQVTRPMR
jgi:hypothetical protein